MDESKKNCQPCNDKDKCDQKSAQTGQSNNAPKGASGQTEKKGQSPNKNLGSDTGRSEKSAGSREEHENK